MRKILLTMTTILTVMSLAPVMAVAAASAKAQVVELTVTERGFEPNSVNVKPGDSVTLKITRKTDATCATTINIPAKKIKKDLPLNQTVMVDLGVLTKGEIRFACGMDMISGVLSIK